MLKFKNYLKMIENSVGTKQYQNLYAKKSGKELDLTKGGELSCAVFVTSILKLFDLVPEQKATVLSAVKMLVDNGWEKVSKKEIMPGDIIVWSRKNSGYQHPHIGFFIGNNKAVSNSWKLKMVVRHSWDYAGRRKIESIWHYPKI